MKFTVYTNTAESESVVSMKNHGDNLGSAPCVIFRRFSEILGGTFSWRVLFRIFGNNIGNIRTLLLLVN